MINFSDFLIEAAAEGKQTHLPHATEHVFHGHEGVARTDSALRSVYNALLGRKRGTPERIEKKIDGAPAFHVGKDKDGKIFVATKSMFNKDPKINYTHEDIERNHGHAPGLVQALKSTLDHAHKVLPVDTKPGEMYKGDLLFSGQGGERGLQTSGEHVSAQANLLKYMWPKGSPEATRAANSKIGFALHTYFNKNGEAQPISSAQRGKFVDHPDVFNYDPSAEINPANMTPENQRAFEENMENARKSYSRIKPEHYDRLTGHGDNLVQFINHRVRTGQEGSGSADEYIDFLNRRAQKDIDSVKTVAAKERKTKAHATLINQAVTNKKEMQHMLDMHGHFQNAKHLLHDVMQKNSTETIQYPGGAAGDHEGFVVTHKEPTTGNPVQEKIVDQRPGSFANVNLAGGGIIGAGRGQSKNESFNLTDRLLENFKESLGATTSSKHRAIHNAFRRSVHIQPRSGSEQIPVRSSVAASRSQHQQHAALTKNKIKVREEIELKEAKSNKLVMNFGRMSPIHEGHGEVIRTVVGLANRTGADHKVIMSHTQDPKKNPLTPQQKLKHARRAFPGVNFDVSSPAQPSLLHHLAKAHADGYKEVTVVGGSDRDTMGQMAQRYNGVKGAHGYYNMKLNFAQAGASRNEGGAGVASYSASKMRDAASKNDFDSFKSMAPKTMSTPHAKDMFTDTRKGMKLESFSPAKFSEFIIG